MNDVIMNIAAHREAEAAARRRNKLANLRDRASQAESLSNAGMFGKVPSGGQVGAALTAAASNLSRAVADGGQAVDDIGNSAGTAATIGEQSDSAAANALAQAQRSAPPDLVGR